MNLLSRILFGKVSRAMVRKENAETKVKEFRAMVHELEHNNKWFIKWAKRNPNNPLVVRVSDEIKSIEGSLRYTPETKARKLAVLFENAVELARA